MAGSVSELALAAGLWGSIPGESLTIVDRGLISYSVFAKLVDEEQGRHLLIRLRAFWLTAWMTSPGNVPKHLGELRSTLDVLILPVRRSERRYPRHVKIKMSNYPRNRGRRDRAPPAEG